MTNNSNKLNEPIGISNFKKLIESKSLFIDKTLFIKEALQSSSEVTLITRPCALVSHLTFLCFIIFYL